MSRQTIAVSVKASKLTARALAYVVAAVGRKIAKEHRKAQTPHGKQSVRKLMGHGGDMLDTLNAQYDDIISWADMYDSASMESKKMIVSCLIRRVEVYRDYRLHIDFNIDFEQFSAGLDISAIAA